MQIMNLTLNRSFFWSAASLALIAAMLVMTVPSLLAATVTRSPDDLQVASALQDHLGKHAEQIELYQERFNGRSIFYTPLPTPKPRAPVRRPPTQTAREDSKPEPETRRDPPIPSNYNGPSIKAIFGDEVWFAGSLGNEPPLRIQVGETKNGIEIVETDPPWKVKVKYQRGEFDVNLFEVKEFLNDKSPKDVPNPPGLIEAPQDPPAPVANEAPAQALPVQSGNDSGGASDKNEKNQGADDPTTSKSPAPDADKTDTSKTKTGNEGSRE